MATLLDRLKEKTKKRGLFDSSQTSITYPTGFLPFDYKNGYKVEIANNNDEVVDTYYNTGIVGGTFNTIIGKSGTAKTTFAVQVASNMVRNIDNAFVLHYDLEQALTYTRIKNITGLKPSEIKQKYDLKQGKSYIEDMFDAIQEICHMKEEFKEDYKYDTGLKDEFNEPIRMYVPTVIIIDSIPTISCKDASDKMEGGTYSNRVAKAISQFYKRMMPLVKEYNVTIIVINHINAKIEINPMAKTQPQLMYLKMDESVPGGNAPIYYANNLLKFVSYGKCVADDDGFDGFKVRCEILKSRTNKAGKSANLIYNQTYGFDPIVTLLEYANDKGLIDGRNPKRYFKDNDSIKFDARKFNEELQDKPELSTILVQTCMKSLMTEADSGEEDNKMSVGQYLDVLENVMETGN